MKKIAFIPARCGSKSIPMKNIKLFCGKPLIYWILKELERSLSVDEIFVATDCEEISDIVENFLFKKVKIYLRKSENAQDTSSTESVMFEFIEKYSFPNNTLFILVQLTNPFLRAKNIDDAVKQILSSDYDSLLSCVRKKSFLWTDDGNSINYDYQKRPRRQDFNGILEENGSFYINSISNILENENRLNGRIAVFEMPEYSGIEIDEEDDWMIAEKLFNKHMQIDDKCTDIKLVLSDVDGVLTDAGMYYSQNGDELKKFNTRDGMGFQLLREKGIKTGIITGENTKIVERRAEKLKIDFLWQGIDDKLKVIKDICKEHNIELNNIAYIGDDINDINVLQNIGIAACPANAVESVKNIKNIIKLDKNGGAGVFREFAEYLLNNNKIKY